MKMTKEVIGVIGPIRAGKDTAGDYISSKLDMPVLQISSPLKMICVERGIPSIRENLISLGTEIALQGDGYLAQYLLDRAPPRIVITGMRQLGQLAVLQQAADFRLISVDASADIRFARTQHDKKLGEANTLQEFIDREVAENSPPNAQRLFECMKKADYQIRNEGSIGELHAAIDDVLASMK